MFLTWYISVDKHFDPFLAKNEIHLSEATCSFCLLYLLVIKVLSSLKENIIPAEKIQKGSDLVWYPHHENHSLHIKVQEIILEYYLSHCCFEETLSTRQLMKESVELSVGLQFQRVSAGGSLCKLCGQQSIDPWQTRRKSSSAWLSSWHWFKLWESGNIVYFKHI